MGDNSDESIEFYRKMINQYAKGKTNERVPNGKAAHAGILLDAMLDNAKEGVRIVTGRLIEKVYGHVNFIMSAKSFLMKKNAKLEIIILNTPEKPIEEHALVVALKEYKKKCPEKYKGQVNIIMAPPKMSSTKHFAVMDKTGFRFEFDDNEVKAVANFNEPETAKRLYESFERLLITAQTESKNDQAVLVI